MGTRKTPPPMPSKPREHSDDKADHQRDGGQQNHSLHGASPPYPGGSGWSCQRRCSCAARVGAPGRWRGPGQLAGVTPAASPATTSRRDVRSSRGARRDVRGRRSRGRSRGRHILGAQHGRAHQGLGEQLVAFQTIHGLGPDVLELEVLRAVGLGVGRSRTRGGLGGQDGRPSCRGVRSCASMP